jgi:hypothetical protein
MNQLTRWQQKVTQWHKMRKHDQVSQLADLVNDPPEDIWGPELSLEQSQGLGCWLDGCLRVYQYHLQHGELTQAYAYLSLAQGKLQQVVSRSEVDVNIRFCCCAKLEQIMVLIVEFCKKQLDPKWQVELSNQIESHVKFLALYPFNESPIPLLKPSLDNN